MKASVKKHVMHAASEAVAPQVEMLQSQIRDLHARVDELAADAGRIAEVEAMLRAHLPRPDGCPGHLAQYNLADLLAWRAAESSAAFVEEHMRTAQMLDSRRANIDFAAGHVRSEGVVLEFGVGNGESLHWLEDALPDRRVVGFDSFEGLPEDWRPGFAAGSFGDVERAEFARAELRVGWFEETLPQFLAELDEPIALLHVDCDLYSSTKTVLEGCMPRLADEAVVVFDEFFNYQGWQHHEAKAWLEHLADNPVQVEYLGFVPSWEQVTVAVKR